MSDLPDYYTQVRALLVEAGAIDHGAYADRPSSPDDGDVYLATDTNQFLACFTDGVWTDITGAFLPLAGGTMTGAIAMGDNKITGLDAPTDDNDAVRKAYADLFTLLTTFNDHKARHQNGGADEIAVTGLSGLLADDQHVLDAEVLAVASALVHASRHQNGGADEISLAGLDGEPSTLTTHKDLTTGIHGAGSNYIAHFGQENQVVSKVIWKDASESALDLDNQTSDISVTDLDLTAYTSANAKFALLRLFVYANTMDASGEYCIFKIRKNGTTPNQFPRVPLLYNGGARDGAMGEANVLVGLDSGQVIEYWVDMNGTVDIDLNIDVLAYIE